MLIWLIVALWCFPGSFRHNICPLSSKLIFFYWVGISYANHKRKYSLCLRISIIPQEIVVSDYIAITCTHEHLIIKRTHTYLKKIKKSTSVWTEASQEDLRPWHKSIQWGKSDSAMYVFVRTRFGKLFWTKVKHWSHKNIHSRSGFSLPRDFRT